MTGELTLLELPSVDEVARPLFGLLAEAELAGETACHEHAKAQLLYVVSGTVAIIAAGGIWTVPPNCALWIPGGMPHYGRGAGHVRAASLYVDPALAPRLGGECAILFIRPLLRELIGAFAGEARSPVRDAAREERLAAVLLDELAAAPVEPLHLPMPTDRRLRRLADALLADPSTRLTVAEWGARIGASDRTMSRLFQRDTGMSLVRWRQQLHVGLALRRLAAGDLVTTIANDLGYESVSAFIAMFRRLLGTTPARYFDRQPPCA